MALTKREKRRTQHATVSSPINCRLHARSHQYAFGCIRCVVFYTTALQILTFGCVYLTVIWQCISGRLPHVSSPRILIFSNEDDDDDDGLMQLTLSLWRTHMSLCKCKSMCIRDKGSSTNPINRIFTLNLLLTPPTQKGSPTIMQSGWTTSRFLLRNIT